jgi:hypothetical protein
MPLGESTGPTGSNRPPYHYVEGDANLAMLCETADLDPTTYGTQDFVVNRGLWALMELFSDGELRILAGDDVANRELVQQSPGQDRYGEFYDKIAQRRTTALAEGGQMADEINKLSRFCGTVLASYVAKGEIQLPDAKVVRPGVSPVNGRAFVRFNEYTWRSPSDVAVILEYGPGITGKKFLDTQLDALQRNLPPFQYIGVSDGPFINQFLVTYLGDELEKSFGREARQFATSGRLFVGREDGMQQATQELLATPQPSGTHEMCDLILLTGVHEASPPELEFAIKNSSQLLRPDGRLMLSAPIQQVKPSTTPYAKQLDWAQEAGYTAEWQQIVNTGDPALGTATLSGLTVLHK